MFEGIIRKYMQPIIKDAQEEQQRRFSHNGVWRLDQIV